MTASCAAFFRSVLLALLLAAPALPAAADDLADFHAAVEEATARYHIAMKAIETRGRGESAAQVARFREAWQLIADRFASNRPAGFADDGQYAVMFTQVDARLVGTLIVIDIGSRDAARTALAPIAETLARLSERSLPTK